MKLSDLQVPKGGRRRKKRLGYGDSSGHGGTSTRGLKGQRARSGRKPKRGFEGGQMPLYRRLPKKGFRSPNKKDYEVINVDRLNVFEADSIVTEDSLREVGILKKGHKDFKILGDGKLGVSLIVKVSALSRGAKLKIEEAGGRVEAVDA
jgi:large subunit ribosomal protein L15